MAPAAVSSSQLPQPQLRVLDTALIAPAAPTPPARSIPLTFFDVKWLHLPPVERVFLYRLSPDADVAAILSVLRVSLSHALHVFYPLAGHVRLAAAGNNDNKRRHELFYRPGDAVPFTTAEYDVDVDDLASDDPVRVPALAPLAPPLPKGRAVLAVQATVLLRGLAVGVTVHHSACDGAGSTHFLHTWAAAAANNNLPPPPVIDRELVIPDTGGLYDIYLKSLPPMITDDDGFEFVSMPPSAYEHKLVATFTLPQALLQGIKGAVAGEAARRGIVPPPRCSSILATYGFIWSCYCRAMRAGGARRRGRMSTTSYFLFSVDQRLRLTNPSVPATYFGNCNCPAIAAAPEEEVAAAGIGGGLFAACAAVAAAVEEEVHEGARDRWDGCVDRVKQAVAHGLLSVAGSPRFRVYDVDFGLGRPAKVAMVSAAKGGGMPVAEARAGGGGGGVEVSVSLPAADGDMERFQKSFADGVAWLSSAIDHPTQQ